MLIKMSQRSGAHNLAKHLLNTEDNEHVTVHELRGFMAQDEDLTSALNEIHVLAKANSKIKTPLVSMSFNPPIGAVVTMKDFHNAINRAEEILNLTNQPRAIVEHSKHGRNHVHVVYSRVDEHLKAIKLPFYKKKMRDLSIELFNEHGWELPKGYINKNERSQTNLDLTEWQIGKRQQQDPKAFKQHVQALWQQTNDAASFKKLLAKNNLVLAKGDKKNVAVLVDIHGDIRSLSRTLSVKAKEVKDKLGEFDNFPSINEAKQSFSQQHKDEYKRRHTVLIQRHKAQLMPFTQQVYALTDKHKVERQTLENTHQKRQQLEREQRLSLYAKGLKGIWNWVSLKTYNLKKKHEKDYQASLERDEQEREILLQRQQRQRETLQQPIDTLKTQHQNELQRFNQGFVETMKSLELEHGLTTQFNLGDDSHSPRPHPHNHDLHQEL